MKFNFKKILPDVYCIALFAAIAFVYFMSPVSKGFRLEQHDSGANDGINVEIRQYRDAHNGETPRWVTSLFGGMPTYQIAPSYDSVKTMAFVEKAYHLWFPDYVWYIFASMLGFYILLRAFDFRQWMAALGAVVWAFSSYFFIIIAASIGIVPEPANGSHKSTLSRGRDVSTIAAAKVSLSGAALASIR